VIQDGGGLIESTFWCEKDQRLILFVDLLSGDGFIEKSSSYLNLEEVGIIGPGEVESACHFN